MRNTYQNITNRIIEIDTRFAKIIASVTNNQYNPGYLYDMANKIYGNKQLQTVQEQRINDLQPNIISQRKIQKVKIDILNQMSAENQFTKGNDYQAQKYYNVPTDNKNMQSALEGQLDKNDFVNGNKYQPVDDVKKPSGNMLTQQSQKINTSLSITGINNRNSQTQQKLPNPKDYKPFNSVRKSIEDQKTRILISKENIQSSLPLVSNRVSQKQQRLPSGEDVQHFGSSNRKQRKFLKTLAGQQTSKNDFRQGKTYLPIPAINNKTIQQVVKSDRTTTLTAAILSSRLIHDQEKSIYTGKFNSQNYVRYIDSKTLGEISQLALQRYNAISTTGNSSIYNGDPNHSPYRPVAVPTSITQLLAMTKAISSGGLRALAGLGQYYFGGRMRIGRTAAQTKTGGFGWQLTSFIAYNAFRGIFLNMTPTPMSFTLGFDIPLIGPLAINVIGGFGRGGFKSQYGADKLIGGLQDSDLHSFNRPKQGTPGNVSNLKQLQKDVLGTNTTNINDFYKIIGQIRQNGTAGSPNLYQKRQAAFSNNLLAGILNKFLKPIPKELGGPSKNSYYADNIESLSQTYKKTVTNDGQLVDFYKQVDISSPNVVLIKIEQELHIGTIGKTLIIPATIKSISDNNSTQWQDTWNNTGRFQPIKAYMGVTRTVDVTFSVFAYTLFNDVNIQKTTKNATRIKLQQGIKNPPSFNKNRDDVTFRDGPDYAAMQVVFNNANKQYHQTMYWLKRLTYPIVNRSGVKRYNVMTNLTIGEYIMDEEVIVNSVNITPSQQFYWAYKFPMLVDVSMSFTVFRKTYRDGTIKGKLYETSRTKYSIPGTPSYLDSPVPADFSYSGSDPSARQKNSNMPQGARLIKTSGSTPAETSVSAAAR